MAEVKEQKTNWVVILLGLLIGLLVLGLAIYSQSARALELEVVSNGSECVDIYAPEPVTQSINVAKRGTIMATFQWFEEPEGTWTLKLDTDPRGGVESWVTEYPNNWGILFTKPMDLPQTITEYECPKPNNDKSVTIVEACDGSATVTIYGGNTRRTWRVNGDEKWVEKYATVEWITTVPVTVEWWHENSKAWKPADETYVTRTEATDCELEITPTPAPTTTPQEPSKPEGCTHDCGVPACTDTIPEAIVNPHVYRRGDIALVKWYPKQGDKVNIYWRLNSVSEWQHALSNSPNDGYEEVKGLGSYDWTFGVQSVNGCAADGIVNASTISEVVDGATSGWVLFR